jgi:hypothetical protein
MKFSTTPDERLLSAIFGEIKTASPESLKELAKAEAHLALLRGRNDPEAVDAIREFLPTINAARHAAKG